MHKSGNIFSTGPLDSMQPMGHIDSAELSCLPYCKKITLRGDASDDAFKTAVAAMSGLDLPLQPNTCDARGSSAILWMGPDEWLWRYAANESAAGTNDAGAELSGKLANLHAAAVDVSDYYALLCLQGTQSFTVLEKGTPLDVSRALASVGQCAQSRFANAAVLLNRVDQDVPRIHIQVRWSYAEYLWHYIAGAIQGFR